MIVRSHFFGCRCLLGRNLGSLRSRREIGRLNVASVDQFEVTGFFAGQDKIFHPRKLVVSKGKIRKLVADRRLDLAEQERLVGVALRDKRREILKNGVKTSTSHNFSTFCAVSSAFLKGSIKCHNARKGLSHGG